jgi:SpoIID/LytB domain protein
VRRLALTSIVLLLLASAPVRPAAGSVPVLIVDGKGFGHGVGMAQDGALWMGRAGRSTNQILGQFYPGTTLAKAGGSVRVVVLTSGDRSTTVAFPQGGEVRDGQAGSRSPGFPVVVDPGGQVTLRFDGSRYTAAPGPGAHPSGSAASRSSTSRSLVPSAQTQQIDPGSTTTTSTPGPTLPTTTTTPAPPTSSTTAKPTTTTAPPPPPTTAAPAPAPSSTSSLWAVPAGGGSVAVPVRSRRYRGAIEATAAAGPLRLINQVDVEVYLRGMGEVRNPSWPAASLRSQAIAARTYALRAMSRGGELCDDQRCQVYLGADAEYAQMNKAVSDSAGQVVTYGRALASTVYSANGGGHEASREEGFGQSGPDFPYLRPAPYETKDLAPWQTSIALSDVAARFGYGGQLTGVRIARAGPSGRAIDVVLEGSAGDKPVAGLTFAANLGLRSTLFAMKTGVADVAPDAPSPSSILQALPDDAAAASSPSSSPATVAALPPGPHHIQAKHSGASWPALLSGLVVLVTVAAATGVTLRQRRRTPGT